MLFGKKENKVKEMVNNHLDLVGECLRKLEEMIVAYVDEDMTNFKGLSAVIDDIETQADKIRRSLEFSLYGGAFMPVFREDLFLIVEQVDTVADKAEAVSDYLTLHKPTIPTELKQDIKQMAKRSVNIITHLRLAVENLFVDVKKSLEYSYKVDDEESYVDQMEWDLLSKLFQLDIDLAQKLVLRDFVRGIASITDRAEDASDRIEILNAKLRV